MKKSRIGNCIECQPFYRHNAAILHPSVTVCVLVGTGTVDVGVAFIITLVAFVIVVVIANIVFFLRLLLLLLLLIPLSS